jgi:hypothetical protein
MRLHALSFCCAAGGMVSQHVPAVLGYRAGVLLQVSLPARTRDWVKHGVGEGMLGLWLER